MLRHHQHPKLVYPIPAMDPAACNIEGSSYNFIQWSGPQTLDTMHIDCMVGMMNTPHSEQKPREVLLSFGRSFYSRYDVFVCEIVILQLAYYAYCEPPDIGPMIWAIAMITH